MTRKRKAILALLLTLVTAAAIVAGCNIRVNASARGRLFAHVGEIHQRPIAVILGTIPESRFGGPNLFYEARIRAAAELYRNRKFEQLIISGSHRDGAHGPRPHARTILTRPSNATSRWCFSMPVRHPWNGN